MSFITITAAGNNVHAVKTFSRIDGQFCAITAKANTLRQMMCDQVAMFTNERTIHVETLEAMLNAASHGLFVHVYRSDVYVSATPNGVGRWLTKQADGTKEAAIAALNEAGPVDDTNKEVYHGILKTYYHEGLQLAAMNEGVDVLALPVAGNPWVISDVWNVGGFMDWVCENGVGKFGPRGEMMFSRMTTFQFGPARELKDAEVEAMKATHGLDVDSPLHALVAALNEAHFAKLAEEAAE